MSFLVVFKQTYASFKTLKEKNNKKGIKLIKPIFISIIFWIGFNPPPCFSIEKSNVERIQVTGSRIKRINIEGPSPLLVLDKEDLENSGYNSVADVLRDTSVTPFGVTRETPGTSSSGEAFMNVHGATALILINGQRVISDPNAEAVDLHLIPIYAVERVEIIKDGSSAIYGSDALGGVVNFIMKENFSGTEFYGRASPTFYKGGSRFEGATVWGNTYPKGSITGVLQFRLNDNIVSSDRKWSKNYMSPISIHPVFQLSNGSAVIANSCPPENRKEAENICEFNNAKYIDSLPLIAQLSGYIQGKYKWNGLNLYSQFLPSYKRTTYDYPPSPGFLNLKQGHKMSIQTSIPGKLAYRFEDAGQRMTTVNYLAMDTAFGAKGYLSSNWDWDVGFKISGTYKKKEGSGLLLNNSITNLIHTGIFDPFTNDKRNLKEALYESKGDNSSLLFLTDAIFSGNIGPIDTALGIQGLYKKYTETIDSEVLKGNVMGQGGSNGSGSRKIGSFFGEMVYSTLDTFEIQVAGRGDYYFNLNNLSKKGSKGVFTFNPKAAFRFQPTNSFLLRGSLGTSFIAPSLHNLYGTKNEAYPYLIDSVACFNELKSKGDTAGLNENLIKDFIIDQKETIEKKDLTKESKAALEVLSEKLAVRDYCSYKQYHAESKKNKDLRETKGFSASLGSVIQINNEMSLTLDGWYIKINGSPSVGINNDTIKVELKKGREFVAKQGVIINRSSKPYNPILSTRTAGLPGIDSKLLNIGSSQISGFDFSFSAFFPNLNYRNGNFYLKEDGIVILNSKSEGFPGRGFKDNIGSFSLPRWKNIATLGWQNKKHNLALKVNSFASVTKNANELESLPIHHRLDLSYQWAINSKTIMNAGWINVLFNNPPMDDTIKSASQINEGLYEVRGPHFYVGFKKLM